jgi:hypothetical protein
MDLDFTQVRQRRLRRKRRITVKPKSAAHGTPLDPRILERLRIIFESARLRRPVDYGPAAPGTIRMLIDYPVSDDWLHASYNFYDRTFSEWMHLIKTYKSCTISNNDIVVAPPFHPFLHRRQAGDFLETLFQKNMRTRVVIQKFIARIRLRLLEKRHIGETDLYTTLPIPSSACVTVYDTKTRSKYTFHAHTIIQCVTTNLTYSSYGISSPVEPKNPYTNLTWHIGQIMTIMEQITTHLLRSHRFLPNLLYSYRLANYDVSKFYSKNSEQLQIGAAVQFFKNIHDRDVISVYDELLEDLHATVPDRIVRSHAWTSVKLAIYNRHMPKELYARWDQLIVSEWIWNNHGFFYNPFNTTADKEFNELYTLSMDWWLRQPRVLIQRAA